MSFRGSGISLDREYQGLKQTRRAETVVISGRSGGIARLQLHFGTSGEEIPESRLGGPQDLKAWDRFQFHAAATLSRPSPNCGAGRTLPR
jgi:hypothetical protein